MGPRDSAGALPWQAVKPREAMNFLGPELPRAGGCCADLCRLYLKRADFIDFVNMSKAKRLPQDTLWLCQNSCIAIEHDHRNSEFAKLENGDFP